MQRRFRQANRKQMLLFPPSVDDWVAGEHLARFIWDCVETFDLRSFYDAYAGEGAPPYDPKMMLATLLYAWSTGTRSSRQIARACEEQIPYRWLMANIMPDHCAFARFRKRHEAEIKGLFAQILGMCQEVGLVRLGRVFLDGTKIKGNASLAANHPLAFFEKEISRMLADAKEKDAADDRKYGRKYRGDELPAGLRSSERLLRLRQAKDILDAKARAERESREEVLRKRQEEEEHSGRKKPGRKPLSPDAVVNHERKANTTDPASRIMKSREGYLQGYNSQAVVTKDQIIIAAAVTQEENDLHQLAPMMEAMVESLAEAGVVDSPAALAADAGYWYEDLPVDDLEKDGPELFIATANRHKEKLAAKQEGPSSGRIPLRATGCERMTRKLRTKRGQAVYRLRCQTVEPVFGQIKQAMGFTRFLSRGIQAAQSEWLLICACFNLKKLHRFAYT